MSRDSSYTKIMRWLPCGNKLKEMVLLDDSLTSCKFFPYIISIVATIVLALLTFKHLESWIAFKQ